MSLCLQNLKDYRDEILKAEIGALLFNLGKTHIGFWKDYFGNVGQKFSSYKEYYQENYFEDELIKNINQDLRDFIFNKNVSIDKNTLKWEEFFKGDASNEDFIKEVFFRGCENINSGIDKGSPKEKIKGKLWISNAFGSFIKEVKKDYFDKKRDCFFRNFDKKAKQENWYKNPDFVAIREFVLKELKNWYSNLLSDNRMPVNDVTLYDQAYMSASMFKATLAGILLNTNESKSYTSNPQSIKWQILGVQYDKLALAEKGLKPAHIVWYREASKQVDEKVKEIIELEYALGNEIYRDESGIYFIVPEGIGTETLSDDLSEVKDKILYAFKDIFNDEVYPYIGLTKPSRGTMNLTYLLDKAKENFLKADYSKKSQICVSGNEIGICQICKSRLVKEKSDEDEVPMCDICKERKKGRRDKWLENQNSETIWIDEIGQNGSVALIGLKFELKEWLNGNLLSSLLVREMKINDNFQNLVNSLKNDFRQPNKKINNTILKDYKGDIPNQSLENLVKTLLLERSIGDKWENFILGNLSDKSAIEFEKRKIYWNKLTDEDIEFLSNIILQFILRKNPSPARLRRIWESTSEFFSKVKSEVFDAIEETRTKESFKKLVPDFANLNISDTNYKQYFSIIDPTPISWQVIIPISKVQEVIEQIQKLYYENFKYVNGKLPLHIGVVVQKTKKPLYVGIKALRNIRRDIKSWSEIKKEGKNLLEDLSCYEKVIEQNNDTNNYYSLYETDNYDYDFKLLPSQKGVKLYNSSNKFVVYPNTFDFEFMDTNTRRNDIFYQNAKRTNELKQNRPYEWSEWENFVNFKEFFNGKTALLHRILSLIYSKIQDWKNNEESFKIFMNSTFKREGIEIENFGIKDYGFEDMKKFIDMFEFWHTALKEI